MCLMEPRNANPQNLPVSNLAVIFKASLQESTKMVLGHLFTKKLKEEMNAPITVHKQVSSKRQQRLLNVLKYSTQETSTSKQD